GNEMLGKLERFYAKSGIERRYSVIPDYTMRDPEAFAFYGKNWELEPFPTTGRRMELFEQESVPLAARACRDAMQQAGVRPDEVTHLIVTTCTGFFAPGLDVMLLRELELSPSTQRLQIGFMGCYAGFNGMRQAHQIITAEPDAVVVQVCIELCSLHYQKDASLDSIVANCLFADGCAAAVWGRDERGGLATIEGTACAVDGDSLDEMSWHIGDHGFRMGLRVDVPKTIERELPEFVEDLLASHTTQRAEIDRWAVHPGGRAILEAAEAALGLEDESLAIPRSVLRDFGNMSSATIFFVLQREFEQAAPGERVVALGFGPGLTFEAALMEAK
ncbi:MAG: type III polyketide synthase, partial [Myxococcota bacterium]